MEQLSIIISTYNEPLDYINKAILSILNQSYQDIEIIVIIDNPSRKDVVLYLQQIQEKDGRLKYYVNDTNLGLVKSLNKALSYSTGSFIARMDADDIATPDRIEKEVSFLLANNLDLVGSTVIDIDEHDKPLHGVTSFPERHCFLKRYLRYDSCIIHPTWLARRCVFEELNGYREIDACEDYDFLTRVIQKGFKIGVVQEPLLYYRINSSGISSTKKTIQKTSLEFLSASYRKGGILDLNTFNQLMTGETGNSLKANYELYYNATKVLKQTSSHLQFVVKGCQLFLTSTIARKVLFKTLYEKSLLCISNAISGVL